jgi:hypothetical protein
MANDRDPNRTSTSASEPLLQAHPRHLNGEELRDSRIDFASSVPRRGNVRPAERHE